MTTEAEVEAVAIIAIFTNMAKNVRWQIAFKSISGILYRVDIYDDGYRGLPTDLLAGPTPFVTEEDSNEDLFHPIRTKSGTLQVCTAIPGGGTLRLEDILPDNNIARPVQLLELNDGEEYVVWQGFLSCETYSQDYVGIPQVLDLSLISVLEAMDSVPLPTDYSGIQRVYTHFYKALSAISNEVGMPLYTDIYFSHAAWNFMRMKIDPSALYDIQEYTNASSKVYISEGLSCKGVIERLCRFMGWVAREQGTAIYLQRIGEEYGFCHLSPISKMGGLYSEFNTWDEVQLSQGDIADMDWMGTGHQRSVAQGAKSVEVVANVMQYKFGISMPESPFINTLHPINGDYDSYVDTDVNFSNAAEMYYYLVKIGNNGTHLSVMSESTFENAYKDCILNPECDTAEQYQPFYTNQNSNPYELDKNTGAFFAKLKYRYATEYTEGLYVVALNEIDATGEHASTVFKLRSIIGHILRNGSLEFKMTALTIANLSIHDFTGKAFAYLKFGTKYWNGSEWTTTKSLWELNFANYDEEPGSIKIAIPITSELSGEVSLELIGSIQGKMQANTMMYNPFYDLFISNLSLEYVAPEYVTESDREENVYYRSLRTKFRDRISVSTDLATNLNNQPSPSLILSEEGKNTSSMAYLIPETVYRRPEVDLLDRLAEYYSTSRQRLNLEARPLVAPLPLLSLNGINDGKVYTPLAESRDWRAEKSTLTCFEIPN